MSTVNIVMPGGTIVPTSSDFHSEEQIKSIVKNRQQIAYDYCVKMGWPTEPTELSFEQIFEIRELPEWKNAINH